MQRRALLAVLALCALLIAAPALAGDLHGRVTDRTGGALAGATVLVLHIASGDQSTVVADSQGRFRVPGLKMGTYRVAVTLAGFSDASRTIVVESDSAEVAADFTLELGSLRRAVTVTADRGVRDTQVVPVRVDTLSAEDLRLLAPTSTGDALVAAPGVTPVGNGPFQVRPRLRGLDSTRVLVLVDGERLNNARTATDRAGVEVGLVDPSTIDSIEVLGGAGSVLYGTDALSGTINILTNRPQLTDKPRSDGISASAANPRPVRLWQRRPQMYSIDCDRLNATKPSSPAAVSCAITTLSRIPGCRLRADSISPSSTRNPRILTW
jgi:hypothetical protein